MAETYGRYDLAMGCRRTAASPSYEIGRRATGAGSETDERDRGGHSWGIIPICRERVVELGNWIKSSPKRPPRSRALRPAQSGCPDTPEISRGKTDRLPRKKAMKVRQSESAGRLVGRRIGAGHE
jgi:hypothetical protein